MTSLLAIDARHTLMVAVAAVLLGWWLCVVLLTLRARRGVATRDANRTSGRPDQARVDPVS